MNGREGVKTAQNNWKLQKQNSTNISISFDKGVICGNLSYRY